MYKTKCTKMNVQKLNTKLNVQGSQGGHPLLAIKTKCTKLNVQN